MSPRSAGKKKQVARKFGSPAKHNSSTSSSSAVYTPSGHAAGHHAQVPFQHYHPRHKHHH